MTHFHALLDLSVRDLKRAFAVKEQIERLQSEFANLLGGLTDGAPRTPARRRRRRMSAAGRAAIGAAARARWARERAARAKKAETKARGAMSYAERARLGAAARWAKQRQAKAAVVPIKRKRRVSAAERARRSARLKAHWAKIKRAGGKRLG